MRYQIRNGNILQGAWNQHVYAGVDNEIVIEELELQKQKLDPYNYSIQGAKDKNQLIEAARKAKRQGQNDVIYDGFNIKKRFKFE